MARWRYALPSLLLAFAAVVAAPRRATAQDGAPGARIEALVAALDSARGTSPDPGLRRAWTRERDGALRTLAIAFLDLAELRASGDLGALARARDAFDRLVLERPAWPWARLGLAEAALETYRRRVPVPALYGNRGGGDHFLAAAEALRAMLARAPDFRPGLDFTLTLLDEGGDREPPPGLLDVLPPAARRPGADPRAALALARAARLHDSADAARTWIERYLADGGDRGTALLERARIRAQQGDLAQAALDWRAGLDGASSAARALYRRDLAWIATPQELAAWDAVPADSLGAWAERFWARRDALELRRPGERLEEHLRRWVVVHRRFRVPDPWRRVWFRTVVLPALQPCLPDGPRTWDGVDRLDPDSTGGWRARERILDHRALAYMRHGEPDLVIPDGPGGSGSGGGDSLAGPWTGGPDSLGEWGTTWVYRWGGQLHLLRFAGSATLGRAAAGTLVTSELPGLGVALALAGLDADMARYAALLQQLPGRAGVPFSCRREAVAVQRALLASSAEALATDTHARTFAAPLRGAVRLHALGDAAAGTARLLVVVGLDARTLEATQVGAGEVPVATLDAEVAVVDSASGAVRRTREPLEVPRRPGDARSGLVGAAFALPIGGGTAEVRVAVSQGGGERGLLVGGRVHPVADGRVLALSDVVLGREGTGLTWRSDGITVPLEATGRYRTSDNLTLYYEAYGLEAGRTYEATVSLRRDVARRAPPAVALTFTDRATGPSLRFLRQVSLAAAQPGAWILEVELHDPATGRRVRREQPVTIVR